MKKRGESGGVGRREDEREARPIRRQEWAYPESEYFDAIRKGLLGRGHSFDVANHICHEIEHAR